MSLSTFVKISKISNLSDARYCAGMMVDILGFDLDPLSADYVSPLSFQEITGWVAGVKFAGEFGGIPANEIAKVLPSYPLDYIETTHLDQLAQLAELKLPLIVRLQINDPSDLDHVLHAIPAIERKAEILIIECKSEMIEKAGSSLSQANIKTLLHLDNQLPELEKLIGKWGGLELQGTPEDQPGNKDYGIVMDVLEALEEN